MKFGQIILVPFPYAELTNKKVRPAVVIAETDDKYKDIVVSAISSVVPSKLSKREILIKASYTNNLRVNSIIKSDRLLTVKKEDVIATLGSLSEKEINTFRTVLTEMIG
jgi:mRNA interferase MazF